jgi:hypothetical protein
MLQRFKVVKQSRADPYSATGHAAPSWHTFDKKVWERDTPEGTHRVTLTRDKRTKATGLGTYSVVLEREGHGTQIFQGTSWQPLVNEVKELSRKLA